MENFFSSGGSSTGALSMMLATQGIFAPGPGLSYLTGFHPVDTNQLSSSSNNCKPSHQPRSNLLNEHTVLLSNLHAMNFEEIQKELLNLTLNSYSISSSHTRIPENFVGENIVDAIHSHCNLTIKDKADLFLILFKDPKYFKILFAEPSLTILMSHQEYLSLVNKYLSFNCRPCDTKWLSILNQYLSSGADDYAKFNLFRNLIKPYFYLTKDIYNAFLQNLYSSNQILMLFSIVNENSIYYLPKRAFKKMTELRILEITHDVANARENAMIEINDLACKNFLKSTRSVWQVMGCGGISSYKIFQQTREKNMSISRLENEYEDQKQKLTGEIEKIYRKFARRS